MAREISVIHNVHDQAGTHRQARTGRRRQAAGAPGAPLPPPAGQSSGRSEDLGDLLQMQGGEAICSTIEKFQLTEILLAYESWRRRAACDSVGSEKLSGAHHEHQA